MPTRQRNMDIRKIYEKATGVNILDQAALWDERGRGYYGEYLVFKEIYYQIPGIFKVLLNVEIPDATGNKTTEIDLLLLHETGIYAFEVKHYKGIIYGRIDDPKWTQFFKTTENSHFNNPVKQNEWHIEAINRMYPDSNVTSFVVFTSDQCELKVTGYKENTYVCLLSDLKHLLTQEITYNKKVYSADQLDYMLQELKPYSKIVDDTVTIDGETVPFVDYLNQLHRDYEEVIEERERELKSAEQGFKRAKASSIMIGTLALALSIAIAIFVPMARIRYVENKYKEFFQKFEYADEITLDDVKTSELVSVNDLVVTDNSDLVKAVDVSFNLSNQGESYHLGLSKESALIIQTKAGEVKEATVYSDGFTGLLASSAFLYRIQPGYFEKLDFKVTVKDVSAEEIEYIKLINLLVYKATSQNAAADGAEITILE